MTNEGRKIEFGVGLLLSHWADVLNIKKTQGPVVFTSNEVKTQTGYKILAGDSDAIVKFLNDHEEGKHMKRDLTPDEWAEVARFANKECTDNAACEACIEKCKERPKKEHCNDGAGMDPWIVKAATNETKKESAITVVLPSGTFLSEADAKTMMDKIEACTKWLKANDRACKLGKHQRVFQQCKHASEDSHTSRLMRR